MPVQINTSRLVIRSMECGDASALHLVYGDPQAMRFIGIGVSPDEMETRRRVGRLMDYERRDGYSFFACVERETGTTVGDCGLLRVPESDGSVELGYRFATASWGRGYATEAAAAVRDHAFAAAGLSRLVAVVRPGNGSSVRVLEKLGFARVDAEGMTIERFGKYARMGLMGFVLERSESERPESHGLARSRARPGAGDAAVAWNLPAPGGIRSGSG